MKKLVYLFAAVAAVATLAACNPEPEEVKVAKIEVYPATATMTVGDNLSLDVTVSPTNADNKKVNWTSSDTAVAMAQDGVVKAISVGTAIITATAADGGGATASCVVTVKSGSEVPVTGVSLGSDKLALKVGGKAILKATVEPADASDKSLSWSSSDDSVASVSDGEVTAKAEGEAKITVKTNDGGFEATCKVTVSAEGAEVSSLEFQMEEYWFVIDGGTGYIRVEIDPEDVDIADLTVEVSDDESGMNPGKKPVTLTPYDQNTLKVKYNVPGDCTVTVSSPDGSVSADCPVHVRKTPKSFELDTYHLAVGIGETEYLGYEFDPDPESVLPVLYYTEDYGISVSEDGEITGEDFGHFTVYVCPDTGWELDSSLERVCNVYVYDPSGDEVSDITLGAETVRLKEGENFLLVAKIDPMDTTYPVAWILDDPDIAEIELSEGGVSCNIVGLKPGKTDLVVRSLAGNEVEAVCHIVVAGDSDVTGVTLPANLEMKVGDSKVLSASIKPSGVSPKSVEWINHNPELVNMQAMSSNAQIKLTALGKPGEAIIEVVVDDYYTAECKVKILDKK